MLKWVLRPSPSSSIFSVNTAENRRAHRHLQTICHNQTYRFYLFERIHFFVLASEHLGWKMGQTCVRSVTLNKSAAQNVFDIFSSTNLDIFLPKVDQWLHTPPVTVSHVAQPLEHVLVAGAEGVFGPFEELQPDAFAQGLPACPAGALHGPERDHHLPLPSTLAVLLWRRRTSKDRREEMLFISFHQYSATKVCWIFFPSSSLTVGMCCWWCCCCCCCCFVPGRKAGGRQQQTRAGQNSCAPLWLRVFRSGQCSLLRALQTDKQSA